MLPLEVGKLYSCFRRLMLFPDKETAAFQSKTDAYWSTKLVLYVEENDPFLVIDQSDMYIQVLAGDKRGWIIHKDWLEIKEITDAAA